MSNLLYSYVAPKKKTKKTVSVLSVRCGVTRRASGSNPAAKTWGYHLYRVVAY